jgi:hypothetical protein
MKSFLFTLKNPHNFPSRRFALKAEKKDFAIYCDSSWGPRFCDIGVSDDCNANSRSYSSLGGSYANGWTVLTGANHFIVKEIEVFEITDESALPNPARLPRKSRFARNPKKVANRLFDSAPLFEMNDRVSLERRL